MMVHIHGFDAYLHTFYYIPFSFTDGQPTTDACWCSNDERRRRQGETGCTCTRMHFIFKFVCEAHCTQKRKELQSSKQLNS